MSIESLYVKNFRNLTEQRISFNSNLNFIVGDNGSGKSSLLEAVFFLGHGKSFRTSKSDLVCHFDEDVFFLNVKDESSNSFGLSKGKEDVSFLIKKNGNRVSRLSELATDFAVQVVTPESFRLLSGGAKERRKFIDLGMFHVKHEFSSQWKIFSKILKQRNALLKNRFESKSYEYWTSEFVTYSELLSELREEYCEQLSSELTQWLKILLPELVETIDLSYYRGWSKSRELSDVLASQREKEFNQGFSVAGAQKFDFKFLIGGHSIEQKLSRGQQKLFLLALTFAQMKLIEKVKQVKPILLIDDIGAELDLSSRTRFKEAISTLSCQILITAIEQEAIKPLVFAENELKEYTMFHVKHGQILESK